jgi:hypothetical protein
MLAKDIAKMFKKIIFVTPLLWILLPMHAKHGSDQQSSSVIITAWDRDGLVDFAACNIPKLPHAPPLFKA